MDPSMLVAFLIKDEADWKAWRETVQGAQGKAIIHIAPRAPERGQERAGAVDEVESFDEGIEEDGISGEGSEWGEESADVSLGASASGEVLVERPVAEAPVVVGKPAPEAPVVVEAPLPEAPVVVEAPTPEAPVVVDVPTKPAPAPVKLKAES
jgi:cysteine protease ATG4